MATSHKEAAGERPRLSGDRQVRLLFATIVLMGYFVTLLMRTGQGLPPISSLEIMVGAPLD
jgi:hypothetical protein